MKIAYYPCGYADTASSRLRVFKIVPELIRRGHEVVIDTDYDKCDVLLVQKRVRMPAEMREAREKGTRVIWDVDDYIDNMCAYIANTVTVDTMTKCNLYPFATIVSDALDVDDLTLFKTEHAPVLKKIVWFGNPENYDSMEDVFVALQGMNYEFITISNIDKLPPPNHNETRIQWTRETVDRDIMSGDLVVLPVRVAEGDAWRWSKSANRLLKAWALGMPVVCGKIPAYVHCGANTASTIKEWRDMIDVSMSQRNREGDATYGRSIALEFTADKIADQWIAVFEGQV